MIELIFLGGCPKIQFFCQNKVKFDEKVQLTGINEHFESDFNPILAN
jgi:hypothetical protein